MKVRRLKAARTRRIPRESLYSRYLDFWAKYSKTAQTQLDAIAQSLGIPRHFFHITPTGRIINDSAPNTIHVISR